MCGLTVCRPTLNTLLIHSTLSKTLNTGCLPLTEHFYIVRMPLVLANSHEYELFQHLLCVCVFTK